MNWENEKSKIISNYQNQFDKFGINNKALFIPGRKQNVRFNVIREIGITPNDSILDVGCGFGDLLSFLSETINYTGKYTGIDITPEFISVSQNKFPFTDFRVLDILQEEITEQWDYVVLSGTLNINIGEMHWDFVKAMISKMFALSTKGVTFDFISSDADSRYEYLYRARYNEVVDFCKTLTKRICMRTDYMPYENAIYLYKNDQITSDNIFDQYKFPEIIEYL
jgi:SAM-dependent methyltransferase